MSMFSGIQGELIDSGYEPSLDSMYRAFTSYFNNPVLTKIKNVSTFSVYMTKTYCLLNKECRYIVVFIQEDGMRLGNQDRLDNMRWVSLQTRTLEDNHDLEPHGYVAEAKGELMAPITRIKITHDASTYSCEQFPITVTLLNVKKAANSYQDRGTIVAALETWETIICVKQD